MCCVEAEESVSLTTLYVGELLLILVLLYPPVRGALLLTFNGTLVVDGVEVQREVPSLTHESQQAEHRKCKCNHPPLWRKWRVDLLARPCSSCFYSPGSVSTQAHCFTAELRAAPSHWGRRFLGYLRLIDTMWARVLHSSNPYHFLLYWRWKKKNARQLKNIFRNKMKYNVIHVNLQICSMI